jgi:hypothetical protein
LPEAVRDRLLGLDGVRVQLIRPYGGRDRLPGTRVFAATSTASGFRVETARLANPIELLALDLSGLAHGRGAGLTTYDAPLWLVCTNGRRDVCCAESGRPVAAALAERWPGATWETTHLGGHRFAATLLALPSGLTLGRLDAASAVEACRAVERGEAPPGLTRGRAGAAPEAQVAELHLRERLGGTVQPVVTSLDGGVVRLRVGADRWRVEVATAAGRPQRQSCADVGLKAAPLRNVVSAVRHDG